MSIDSYRWEPGWVSPGVAGPRWAALRLAEQPQRAGSTGGNAGTAGAAGKSGTGRAQAAHRWYSAVRWLMVVR